MAAPGRPSTALRQLFLKVGVNAAAAGSAHVEAGNTKVAAAVYGPHEAARGGTQFSANATLVCDVRYAPFASRVRRERQGTQQTDEERAASNVVAQALTPCVQLDRYPKSVIEVHVLVIEADGGELAAAINAACLALVDAGIEMVDMVAAACAASRAPAAAAEAGAAASAAAAHGPASLLVDPTAADCAAAAWQLTVALMPRRQLISYAHHSGEAPPADFVATLQLAMDACATTYADMRECLLDSGARKLGAAAAAASVPAAAAGVAALAVS